MTLRLPAKSEWPGVGHRLPGVVLIGAFVVMVAGAATGFLAPSLRDAPPFVTDDVASRAAAIAGNPAAWRWANGLILAAGIATALGLVPFTQRFEGRGRPWAGMGLVAFAFAAAFDTIDRSISIGVTTWAAQQYPDPTALAVWEAFRALRLGTAFTLLAFLALGLYGLALREQPATDGLGWVFVAIGLGGILLEVAGGAIPAYVYLGTAGLGAASWRLGPRSRRVARSVP